MTPSGGVDVTGQGDVIGQKVASLGGVTAGPSWSMLVPYRSQLVPYWCHTGPYMSIQIHTGPCWFCAGLYWSILVPYWSHPESQWEHWSVLVHIGSMLVHAGPCWSILVPSYALSQWTASLRLLATHHVTTHNFRSGHQPLLPLLPFAHHFRFRGASLPARRIFSPSPPFPPTWRTLRRSPLLRERRKTAPRGGPPPPPGEKRGPGPPRRHPLPHRPLPRPGKRKWRWRSGKRTCAGGRTAAGVSGAYGA